MNALPFEPRVLKCPELGLVIEVRRDKKWASVIARDASHTYVKRVKISFLDLCSSDFEYPKGIGQAAERFLHPSLGIATVSPEAQLYLESIMKNYSTMSSAKRALAKIGEIVSSLPDKFIHKNGDSSFDLDDDAAKKYQANPPKERPQQRYLVLPNADFSKRRGGFRLTLDAIHEGDCHTASEIWEYVKKSKPDYKLADIYSDITMGRKYGYIKNEERHHEL